jgi:transcription antitermination factor NusG
VSVSYAGLEAWGDSIRGFALSEHEAERRWFAVCTFPQHEKSASRQLALRAVEAFLPTYETVRTWKNRQKMKLTLPLFPTYLFVHITHRERGRVLESPGVIQIVGNGREPVALPEAEIEFLRTRLERQRIEPYNDLVVGKRVRIRSGLMQGVEGTLVRRSDSLRFVLTVQLINQHAAIQVDADDLEPVRP